MLLLNYEYPPLGGGAGVATAALAHRLAGLGATVHVLTSGSPLNPPAAAPRLTIYPVRCRRKGVHDAGIGAVPAYLGAALPVARRLLRSNRYHVAHFFFSLPTGALIPLLDFRDTAIVISLRGSDVPGYDPTRTSLRAAHQALRPLTRWLWRRADRVVALSESLGRLARVTDPALSYRVIHNGVDLARFRPSEISRPPMSAPVRCLAVARLVQRKGLPELLQALALLEPGKVHLEIVGSGPQERGLRGLAERLGVSAHVRFSGALSHDEVTGRYREADLFTLAPYQEAFGNVFAEAMASGLPVVGTRVGGIPEFVDHGAGGVLVPPRDPCALAEAIRRLADDGPGRARMGAWNRNEAKVRLSWDHVVEQYLEAYHDAMRHRRLAKPGIASAAAAS